MIMQNFYGGSDGGNFYPVHNQYGVNIGYTDGCPLTFSFNKEDNAVNKIQHIPSDKE